MRTRFIMGGICTVWSAMAFSMAVVPDEGHCDDIGMSLHLSTPLRPHVRDVGPCVIFQSLVFISPSTVLTMSVVVSDSPVSGSSISTVALRTSRRLRNATEPDESAKLVMPEGCDLVAGTLLVFRWQEEYCVLQTNLTLYCWGRRRSGAIEHVLEKNGWTHSPQLHRINSALVSADV